MRLRPFLRRFRSDVLSWSRSIVLLSLITALAAGTAWAAYAELWPAMVAHSYFRLRAVKVICDSVAAKPAGLAARAGLYAGTSLWEIDPDRVRHSLASMPWVRDVRIWRRFPDQVSLEVYRRDPVAATVIGSGPYLIDGDGVVYREEGVVPYADLPYLTGWSEASSRPERVARLRLSLALLRAFEDNNTRVSQLHVDERGEFWLYAETSKVGVRLGRSPRPEIAASRLRAVWSAVPGQVGDLLEIDLSYPDRAILKTQAGRVRTVISALAGVQDAAGAEDSGFRG